MRYLNSVIWRINKSIQQIKPLLSFDYSKFIDDLTDLDIPDNEKKLLNRWIPENGMEFNQRTQIINNSEINYIKAIAKLEVNTISCDEIILPETGLPIPKDIRVDQFTSRVIFIDRQEYSYAIVSGSKSIESRIRGTLMDSNKKREESRWGHIQFSGLQEFLFDKSFYYWLVESKGKNISCNGKTMKIIDVKGFKSNTDRNTHSYSGEGSNIDREIPLKSLISMDEKLISLYIVILYNSVIYSFYLDFDGRTGINIPECGEHATQNPAPIETDKLLLDIYFDIIPFLRLCHNTEIENGWDEHELLLKKQFAIEVIKDLMEQNYIAVEDITSI